MNTNRGIFDGFPTQPGMAKDSPFAVVPETQEPSAKASPFSNGLRHDSPFTVMEDKHENRLEPGRPARVPEKRKTDSPFQVAEAAEGFGFEPAAKTDPQPAQSPFANAPQQHGSQPFSAEASPPPPPPAPASAPAPNSTQAALAAFGNWSEPPPINEAPPAPAPQRQPEAAISFDESMSDSFSIRQLELRAIFGVDREMNTEEILQRSRALPGIRHIARVGQKDMSTIEGLRNLLPNLGFGSGMLKLYAGSVPLEFIREGAVLLAVQTDGGFAPGVRETLMLVARELGKNS